jgi:FkbM family methyltransferase
MSFISHAQNFEDIMLWRALKHVPQGCYVDVGAEHPETNSVSKAFYDRGWRGIHVEPTPQYAQLLRDQRPGEQVLEMALADFEGELQINVFPDTGLSTAITAFADAYTLKSGKSSASITVPASTLSTILTPYQHLTIHWLKIDVEGFEVNVLRGWDSKVVRPWILLIEATIPNSPQTNHEEWEHIVIEAGYEFVYFDGLNRFYTAQEHPELKSAFSAPPNVFDDFVLKANLDHARRIILNQLSQFS